MPRIGELLATKADLEPVLEELRKVRLLATEQGVERVRAVGTSALRRSASGADLVSRIETESGIRIEILNGQREAELTALGIFANETQLSERVAFLDIGGGSTEISFSFDGKLKDALSIEVGASGLEQLFFRIRDANGKLLAEQRADAEAYLDERLEPLKTLASKYSGFELLGSSGTVRTLERLRIEPKSPARISLKAIEAFSERLARSSRVEILAIDDMEANRADVLLPGCLILQKTMHILSVASMRVTHFSLRHGVLEEELSKLR